ncbi:MAG: glutamine amidotransferase [Limisphaerales bacterium]
MLGALLISGREWLWPAAVFLAVALGALVWNYRRVPAPGVIRGVCLGLKLLGFLLLAACVLEPLWSGQRARPGANLFVLLADNSQGMQIKDRDATQTRAGFLRSLLTGDTAAWIGKLEENFQLRRYFFDSRLQSARDFSELSFDGRASSMGAALRHIAERYQGQPLAGLLLLTDGNATDLPGGKLDPAGLPPIYPVVIGNDTPIKDIALQQVAVSQTAFEDAPVNIQADVVSGGYSGRSVVAELFDANGRKVADRSLTAPRDGEPLAFRFELKPEKPGISFYHLRVSAKDELAQFDQPETSTEATLANNRRLIVVDRGQGPYRILYVSGRPTWEFKFLNRALDEDDQVQLVSLIRIAKREPKFDFRGRPGESSNPLFRGFGNQSQEEIERYDQPVLVRLNTRDAAELAGGFPKTAEDLYAYRAVVLDHLEAGFFTRDQMLLLQKFVSERGGGFLMLGGAESFHEGQYDHTPIGDMLPVYLDHVVPATPQTNLSLTLTHEGWLQPWARLRSNEAEEKQRLEAMPPFAVMNRVRDVKPGASAIATVHDDQGHDAPALVAQRFGNGRVGALMIGDLWRWGLRDAAMHRDMDKAWRQLFRWLIADVPNRVDVQVEPKRDDPNQAILLQVRVRDKNFQPLDNAAVSLNVRTVASGLQRTNGPAGEKLNTSTNAVRLAAEPSATEAGLYEATYVPRETGGYLAEAVVTDAAGAEVGRAETGWTADPAAEEFRSLKPNRALLELIAKQTGGEVITADKLGEFAAALPNRQAPITESWTFPLWHQPAVFLLALACFLGEWGLRRWKGLA